MGFKKMVEVQAQKYEGKLTLPNDGDYIDVVFLYRSVDDVLTGPTHYIKSNDYSGYVHCLNSGCPACANTLRVQPKMFIPCWIPDTGEIIFWDRNESFFNVLSQCVFKPTPNPSEYVFRITREGEARSRDTKYHIMPYAQNTVSWDEMLKSAGAKINADGILDAYESVCRDVDAPTMSRMLKAPAESLPVYQATPRAAVPTASAVNALDTIPAVSDVCVNADDIEDGVDFD